MITERVTVPSSFDRFEALVVPPLPGSEQLSLQQRRAIETPDAGPVDRAVLQQRGMFASAEDLSAALTPTAPLAKAMMIMKLNARFRIPGELYLAGQTAVKVVHFLGVKVRGQIACGCLNV
jgi:hypothetical protein